MPSLGVYRFIFCAAGALALAAPVVAAPLVGKPLGSAAVNVAIAATPNAAPPAAVPDRFAVVSAIRFVYRDRLGLPPGYMASARSVGLLGFFAAQGSESDVVPTPDTALRVFSETRPTPSGWPRGPEFVSRRPPAILVRDAAPLDWPIAPQWIDRTARLDLDRRLASGPSETRIDADPPPPDVRPLNPRVLLSAFSLSRGQPGYLRFAFPPAAGTIVVALPATPVDATVDATLSYIYDLSSENVLRVFNNPAATLAALFAGLIDDPLEPAPLAAGPASPPPLRVAGITPSGGSSSGIRGPFVEFPALPPITVVPDDSTGGGGGKGPPVLAPVPLPLPLFALLSTLGLLMLLARRRRAPV